MVGMQQYWQISVWVPYGVLGLLENGYAIFWIACFFSFSILRHRMMSKICSFSDADACCLKPVVVCDGYLYLHAEVSLIASENAFFLFYFCHCLVVVA